MAGSGGPIDGVYPGIAGKGTSGPNPTANLADEAGEPRADYGPEAPLDRLSFVLSTRQRVGAKDGWS